MTNEPSDEERTTLERRLQPPVAIEEIADPQIGVTPSKIIAVPPKSQNERTEETTIQVQSVPPIVFISFSHDSDEHRNKVIGLGSSLLNNGCDCRTDFYKDTDEDWPTWMSNQLLTADVILCVTTQTYHMRFRGNELAAVGKGVGYEAPLIRILLSDKKFQNVRIFPVFFDSSDKKYIPLELKGFDFFDLGDLSGYEKLLRKIHRQPEHVRPEIGERPELPPKNVPPMFDISSIDREEPSFPEPENSSTYDSAREFWLEVTVSRVIDVLQVLRNDKLRLSVLNAVGLPNETDREKLSQPLEQFLRMHTDPKTFNLETTSLVIAELDGLRSGPDLNKDEQDKLCELQDLLLPLCLSPEIKQQVSNHLANHGAALISDAVATEVGAELATAAADGLVPGFQQDPVGKMMGRGLLKFINPAIGDPSPDAMVAEILHGLADQLGASFKAEIQDERDVRRRIQLWADELSLHYRVHLKAKRPRFYCIITLPKNNDERQKWIGLLGRIRQELPDLVFYELFHDAAAKKGEEIVMLILKSRFPNGGTR